MLARLSIRDIVLIDRLDIDFTSRLSVLTGETGAGKSILLDAFALALGARGDVALVRQGGEQGQGPQPSSCNRAIRSSRSWPPTTFRPRTNSSCVACNS